MQQPCTAALQAGIAEQPSWWEFSLQQQNQAESVCLVQANALSSQTQAALAGAARVVGRRRLADAGGAGSAAGAAAAAGTAGGATPPGTPAAGVPAPGSTSAAAAGGTPAADTAPIAPPASTSDAAAAAWDYYKSRGA
jgi:hypothetical protein